MLCAHACRLERDFGGTAYALGLHPCNPQEPIPASRKHKPEKGDIWQVSQELIRMAILWHEQWHEALEEASRLYFGDSNVPGMLAILSPLHRKMREQGAVTLKEIAFVSVSPPSLNPHRG